MQFRYKALQKARQPDALDAATKLADPRGWTAVLAITALLVGAAVWMVTGSIPRTIRAAGVLSYPDGVSQVQSLYTGQVISIDISVLQPVAAGDTLMTIRDQQGRIYRIDAPFGGDVIDIPAGLGQVVTVGTTAVTMERTDGAGDRMVALLLVPEADAAGIRPGADVKLSVSTAPSAAFGLLRARVASVSPFALSRQSLDGLLGGSAGALGADTMQAPELVVAELLTDPATPSGYVWTGRGGPPFRPRTQTLVQSTILIAEQKPLSYVFGS